MIVADGSLSIRAMRDTPEEFGRLAAWRNQPHVRPWWDPDEPPATAESVSLEHGDDVRGRTATRACVIEEAGVPVGFVQFYPWAAYPEDLSTAGITVPDGAWSLDILIGDPDRVGRGLGPRVVRSLCDHLFAAEGASAVCFGVAVDNERARRAYEKAGMTPTVEYLDTDTRDGRRVRSVLMVRHVPR